MDVRLAVRRGGALLLCLLLAACGGGGGGGSGNSVVFTANPTSVSFTFSQGQTPAPQSVTITATGSYSGTLYVAAAITGTGLAADIPITVSGTTANVQLQAASGLTAGTYSGTVTLKACSDSACSQQVGNSPVSIAYTVTVQVPLALTPANLTLTAVSGTPQTQVIGVQLPAGQTSFTTTVETGSPWLTVTNPTASGFTASLASLPSGTYVGTVLVTAGTQTGTLNVNYTVTAPAGGDKFMAVQPLSLTLATVEDATTTTTLGVTPPSWSPQVTALAEYPSGTPNGWLTVTPASGGFQVIASAMGLKAGYYTADIRVSGAYPQSDVVVPVTLTVGVGLVRPADIPIAITAETTAGSATLAGSVPVNVVAGPAVSWTAASDQPWLVLSNASGTTGGSFNYAVDVTQIAAFANAATYVADVTITPSLATMSPVTFSVNLAKQLPQITSLAPYTQLTGQPARVILRGSGFAGIASTSLAARFTIDGTPATSVTLVNDTEVIALFAQLSAGSHTVAASNALTEPTSTGSVTAVAPSTYAYTALPTGGAVGYLAYDPQRNSLYAANRDLGEIMSFHYSGSSWTLASVPLAAAYDVGLSIDGTALYVLTDTATASSSSGSIAIFDPVSLATVTSPVANNGFLPGPSSGGYGVPSTNDGRGWLGLVSSLGGQFGEPATVTTDNLVPTVVTPGGLTSFYGGPWFAVSRDGERLVLTQGSSASPQPPMLYVNAADGIFATIPPGPNNVLYSYKYSLSEKGDRVLFNSSELRDGSFNVVGLATVPTQSSLPPGVDLYIAITGQLSLDGARLYLLTYGSTTSAAIPGFAPRVFVFDAQTTSANLNVLGYFDINDNPSCSVTGTSPCFSTVTSAISLDGKTLFFAGGQNFIVAPIPQTLTPVTAAPSGPSAKAVQRRSATPWPLQLH